MAGAQIELARDLVAAALLEPAHRHDVALHVGQPIAAHEKLRVLLGAREEFVDFGHRGTLERLVVERFVRAGAVVAAPHVARGVPDDRREQGTALVG